MLQKLNYNLKVSFYFCLKKGYFLSEPWGILYLISSLEIILLILQFPPQGMLLLKGLIAQFYLQNCIVNYPRSEVSYLSSVPHNDAEHTFVYIVSIQHCMYLLVHFLGSFQSIISLIANLREKNILSPILPQQLGFIPHSIILVTVKIIKSASTYNFMGIDRLHVTK